MSPIREERTLRLVVGGLRSVKIEPSRVVFGSGDGMRRWNAQFRSLNEKRDEGKRTAPCSDNEFDWSRMGSNLSRANPVESSFRLVKGGLRSVKIDPSQAVFGSDDGMGKWNVKV
jgi:hypothetical protein